MFNYTMRSGSRLLRCGFTTGTCAALAAAGAAELLLTGHAPERPARKGSAAGLPSHRRDRLLFRQKGCGG